MVITFVIEIKLGFKYARIIQNFIFAAATFEKEKLNLKFALLNALHFSFYNTSINLQMSFQLFFKATYKFNILPNLTEYYHQHNAHNVKSVKESADISHHCKDSICAP